MDFTKKRKTEEENGSAAATLTPEDTRKILEPLTKEQLLDILQNAAVTHNDVLDAVRGVADRDVSLRKLFIRGLSVGTTSDTLRTVFSPFGTLDEAIVILDKTTGKSKGYGFVTYKHADSALLALKEPSKQIDGRVTVTQLAAAGLSSASSSSSSLSMGIGTNCSDVLTRKIYVGGVPAELSAERLLGYFLMYGEVEEGPLGFDKVTGKSRGFAFFVYKTEEGAKAALVEPVKNIDGHQVSCKLAVDNKKFKGQGQVQGQPPAGIGGNGLQPRPQSSVPGPHYGGPGYGGFSGGNQVMPNSNYGSFPSSIGGSGFAGGGGGYGAGLGGAYGVSQYGGPGGSSEFGGLNNTGSSMYRLPPSNSGGMPSQHHLQSSLPRVPPGGMYQGMPPYH